MITAVEIPKASIYKPSQFERRIADLIERRGDLIVHVNLKEQTAVVTGFRNGWIH